MANSIEKAILHAAEAAMAHMVIVSRNINAKMISEGALYEVIGSTVRRNVSGWVNHEHKVSLPHRKKAKNSPGDHKRVDFAIEHHGKTYFLETKIASRTEAEPTLNVSVDLEKLLYGQTVGDIRKPIGEHAYLIVLNLRNDISNDDGYGHITWNEPLEEDVVTCIGTYAYKTKTFVRTASVFRIQR